MLDMRARSTNDFIAHAQETTRRALGVTP